MADRALTPQRPPPANRNEGAPPQPPAHAQEKPPPSKAKTAVLTTLESIWSPRLVLALGRLALRGPLPGIAPLLAAEMAADPSLNSGRHRAAIALGALGLTENMFTGDHQIQWKRQLRAPRARTAEAAILRNTPDDELSEEVKAAVATIRQSNKNVSEAINKSLAAFTQLGKLSTSAISYWHVVAGKGATPIGSSAALMGAGLAASLVITAWYYKELTDIAGSKRPRAHQHGFEDPEAHDKVRVQSEKYKFTLLYGLAGTLGVAGVLTGLISATKSQDGTPAWQSENFFPVLWAAYNLMSAQVSMMRSLKDTPAPFMMVQADNVRDFREQRAFAFSLQGREPPETDPA